MRTTIVSRPPQRRRQGLTLIELVLVVAVLAILAGFIVPRLGFIRNLAGDSGNATTIADATNQAVLYNTAIGHYPQGEDTLLNSGGTALDTKLNGTLKKVLTTTTLDDLGALSLVAQLTGSSSGGTITLYNQSDTVGSVNPNTDDNTSATLSVAGTNVSGIPAITTAAAGQTTLAVVNNATPEGANVILAAYGASGVIPATGAPKDGTQLVALGYGTNSQINGKTGLEPPVLFDKTVGEYTRPIFLLKIFPASSTATGVPPGTSAATSITIGFDGSTAGTNLAKYNVDQNR